MGSELDIGYAWVVATASWTATVLILVLTTSGIYYPYLIDYYEESAANVGFALALIPALKYFLGVLIAIIVKAFGCRIVVILASFMVMCGCLLMAYSTSITAIFLACSLIGIGICANYFVAYFILDVYFKKYFTLVISIKAAINGAALMMAPYINRMFVINFGWQHSYLLLSAISYHLVLCGVIYRAPKISSNEESEELSLLVVEQENNSPQPDLQIIPTDEKRFSGWLGYIYEICHLRLFKCNAFVVLVVVSLMHGVIQEGVEMIIPDDMLERGATLRSSQLILTVYGAGSVIGRPVHYLFSNFFSNDLFIHSAVIYFLAFLALLICITTTDDDAVYVTMVFFGFSVGWYNTILPLIVKSVVDDFFFGLAWVNSLYGVSACIGITFLGYLRDEVGNFWLSEFVLLCMTLINAVLLFGFIVYRRMKGKTC
ncbi:monocarboxylate transporter 6-like isoform X1 [Anneissia japonica]|uniref:monocarboxylate transporter 6-like isoform X1 n=1 Tax=Anneissia japonica TaxID=1529436 RepID=UPI00142551CD|nr:monocarboxylate transporter 6-like isoform X1 [Anneissia japonica]